MANSKPKALKRRRPALIENNPLEDSFVASLRLGLSLHSLLDKFFEADGITLLQFNILRILYVRDPETQGIPAGTFAARMMTPNPDIPRMLDRLVKSGLVERASSPTDRRVVLIKLTQKGADLVEEATPKLLEHNKPMAGDLSVAELRHLAELLQRLLANVLAYRPHDT